MHSPKGAPFRPVPAAWVLAAMPICTPRWKCAIRLPLTPTPEVESSEIIEAGFCNALAGLVDAAQIRA